MRRLASLAVAALLLAGCGGSAAPSAAPASASASAKPAAASTSAPASAKPASSPGAAASAKPAATAPASAAASSPAAAKPAASAAASATGKLEPLKTAFGGQVILQIPLWSAIDGGFFKKYGFDPAEPLTMSGRTALDSLIAGQVDLIGAGPYQTALGVGSGAKVRMIAAFSNKEPFIVISSPSITSPQQLVGSKVATSGPASESATAFTLYLKKVGVDPKSVAFITMGTTSQQLPALLSGAVGAAAWTPPIPHEDASKVHILQDLSKIGISWIPNSFVVPQATVEQQPDKAVRMLQALEEGAAYAYANPDFAKGLVKKYIKLTDPTDLDNAFTAYKALQAKNLTPTQDALDSVMGQVLDNQKDMTKEKIQPFYTSAILDRLKASGFLDKNGAPGS